MATAVMQRTPQHSLPKIKQLYSTPSNAGPNLTSTGPSNPKSNSNSKSSKSSSSTSAKPNLPGGHAVTYHPHLPAGSPSSSSSSSCKLSAAVRSSARRGGSSTNTPSPGPAQQAANSRRRGGALSPGAATDKYRRVLTDYELDEIRRYPNVYFVGATARKIHGGPGKGPNCGFDDSKNRYRCIKNDHLAYRYEVVRGLGKGSFGDVVKAYDHKTKSHVAIKIIRNERRFHKQAQSEVRLLDLIKRQDKKNKHNLVHMKESFTFRGHLCITFELMHTDLYATLKKRNFKGFDMSQIRDYAKQLVTALRVLRRTRIIHCDLKPENILLKQDGSNEIKVIDFGSSCFDTEKLHTYIQSRFYRSPEVILGGAYGTPIDMWSLGCILAELNSGRPLFPGNDEKEQLLYQLEVLGSPPAELVAKGSRSKTHFHAGTNSPINSVDRKGRTRLPGTRALSRGVGSTDPVFLDFISRCLAWDPQERMTPREAAHHQFVTGVRGDCVPALASEISLSGGESSTTPPVATVPMVPTMVPVPPSVATSASDASTSSTSTSTTTTTSSNKLSRRRDSRQAPGIVAFPTPVQVTTRSKSKAKAKAKTKAAAAAAAAAGVTSSTSTSSSASTSSASSSSQGGQPVKLQRAHSEGVVSRRKSSSAAAAAAAAAAAGGAGGSRQQRGASDSRLVLGGGGDGGGGGGADGGSTTVSSTSTRTRTSTGGGGGGGGGPISSRSRRAIASLATSSSTTVDRDGDRDRDVTSRVAIGTSSGSSASPSTSSTSSTSSTASLVSDSSNLTQQQLRQQSGSSAMLESGGSSRSLSSEDSDA